MENRDGEPGSAVGAVREPPVTPFAPLDISDVERWVGRPLAIAQLKEPISANDIRRWVQGMQNPNRLYYDDKFARQGALGEMVAPQSFLVCCTGGLGAVPGLQGNVPGVHMLLGGDEYWFYGPRIRPGDRIRTDAMLFDYRLTDTKFGGPTLFSRGDTSFFNQNGEVIGKLRSTSIRYNPENARRLNALAGDKPAGLDREATRAARRAEIRLLPHDPEHVRRDFAAVASAKNCRRVRSDPFDSEFHHRMALLHLYGLGFPTRR